MSDRVIVVHYGLANLPNTEGYRFRGMLPDGDLIPCVVKKSGMGTHYAASEETGRGVYDKLRGWMPYLNQPSGISGQLPDQGANHEH